MSKKITLENFGPFNRDVRGQDGKLYRICNSDPFKASGNWYVLIITNINSNWGQEKHKVENLESAIAYLNSKI